MIQQAKRAIKNAYVFVKIVSVLLLLGGVFLGKPVMLYLTVEQLDLRVSHAERVATGTGERSASRYLVYANGEVFENTDVFWFWKYNSADLQARLVPGEHTVKVTGWRVPLLGWHRNIVAVK